MTNARKIFNRKPVGRSPKAQMEGNDNGSVKSRFDVEVF